jgi:hypothetical protein
MALTKKVNDLDALASAAPSLDKALKPLREARTKSQAAEMERLLAARTLASLDPRAANELQMLQMRSGYPRPGGLREQSQALTALLRKLAALVSGNAEKGAGIYSHAMDLVRELDKKSPRSAGPPMAMNALGVWLGESCGEPALLPLALDEARKQKLGDNAAWRIRMATAMLNRGGNGNSAAACTFWLEKLGFLADAAHIDLMALSEGGSESTIFDILLTNATQMISQADREKLAASLRQRKPRTFGGDFAAMRLQGTADAAQLEFARAHQEDFARLKSAQKVQVLGVFRSSRSPQGPMGFMPLPTPVRLAMEARNQFSPELSAALAPLMEGENQAEHDAVEAVKAGRKPDLSRMTSEKFKSACCDELSRLFESAPAEALTFYEQAAVAWESLLPPAISGSYGPKETLRTELLTRLLMRNADTSSLALAMRCCLVDRSGRLDFPFFAANNLLFMQWREAGGNASALPAWETVMSDLDHQLGDASPVLVSVLACESMGGTRDPKDETLLQWARKRDAKDSVSRLAEACRMAELLCEHDHTLDQYSANFNFRLPSPPALEPAWRYYTSSVKDESLPEYVRLMVAYQLCNRVPCYVPDEIYRTGTRLAASFDKADNLPPRMSMDAFLRGFATLKVDKDWEETAATYWSARDQRQIPAMTSAVCAMVALQAGDSNRRQALIRSHGGYADFSRGLVTLLAQKGLAEDAAAELKRSWQKLLFRWSVGKPMTGRTPPEQIERVVKSCSDPAIGLLAEFILTDATLELRNENTDTFIPSSRYGKLSSIASRLAELKEGDLMLRSGLASALVMADASTSVTLAPLLAEGAANIRQSEALPSKTSYFQYSREQVLASEAAEGWRRGDFATVQVAFDPAFGKTNGYNHAAFARTLSTILCEMWEHRMVKDTPEARKILQLIAQPNPQYSTESPMGTLLASLELWTQPERALSEKVLDSLKWSLNSNSNLRDRARYTGPRLFDWLAAFAAADKSPDAARRKVDAALRVLRERTKLRAGGSTSAWDLCCTGLFTPDELCDRGLEFAQAWPASGYFADSLAALAFDLGRTEDELAFLRLAISQTSSDSSALASRLLHEAGVLIRARQKEKAVKSLEAMDLARLTAGQKRERETLLRLATTRS